MRELYKQFIKQFILNQKNENPQIIPLKFHIKAEDDYYLGQIVEQQLSENKDRMNSEGSCQTIYYFLFVNTKSGNKEGEKCAQLCQKRLKYMFQDGTIAYVETFDLFDPARTKKGFEALKKLSQEGKSKVRAVICGGDGTIPWVLSRCLQEGVDFQKIAIGVVPIGTGNDFSRSLGWGSASTKFDLNDFSKLNSMVHKWKNSGIGYYDVWDICIETDEDGCFFEIKNQVQHKKETKRLKKSFTNYFGIGLEARVVYTVQQHRGSNAILNKIIYTLVGARNFFKPMPALIEFIQNFKQTEEMTEKQEKQSRLQQTTDESMIGSITINKKSGDVIFPLNRNLKGIACLNCTSYMAGLRKVWETKKKSHHSMQVLKESQQYDDGNLEFVGFSSEINLALERVTRRGYRVGQGPGPFEIQFKRNEENPQIFMQVDGESLKVRHLKKILVKRSEIFPHGRVPVMVNRI